VIKKLGGGAFGEIYKGKPFPSFRSGEKEDRGDLGSKNSISLPPTLV